jgi:hypothetical protein
MRFLPILIAGGGPVGMTLALALARLGVQAMLVERNPNTTQHPKMDITNVRSMELFRRLGLAETLRRVAVPEAHSFDVAWVTSMAGYELHRFAYPSVIEKRAEIARNNDGSQPLEPAMRVSQVVIEPALKRAVEAEPRIVSRFGTALEECTQDADGTAIVRDRQTAATETIRCAYLAGRVSPSPTMRSDARWACATARLRAGTPRCVWPLRRPMRKLATRLRNLHRKPRCAGGALASRIAALGNAENESYGIELGYAYRHSPIVCAERDAEISDDPVRYIPTTTPGARLPSVLLADGSALFDRLGPWFTLIAFGMAPDADLVAAARRLGMPLRSCASINRDSSTSIVHRRCLSDPISTLLGGAATPPRKPTRSSPAALAGIHRSARDLGTLGREGPKMFARYVTERA